MARRPCRLRRDDLGWLSWLLPEWVSDQWIEEPGYGRRDHLSCRDRQKERRDCHGWRAGPGYHRSRENVGRSAGDGVSHDQDDFIPRLPLSARYRSPGSGYTRLTGL